MATITEDYCSYEVAKLLNEKGFQVDTDKDYWKIGEDGTMYFMCSIGAYTSDPNNKNAFYRPASSYPCPTQSMAMKWLREIHLWNIHAEQKCFDGGNRLHSKPYLLWCPYIQDVKLPPEKWDFGMSNRKDVIPDDFYYKGYKMAFDTYEEACEEAIKYCLDNLI